MKRFFRLLIQALKEYLIRSKVQEIVLYVKREVGGTVEEMLQEELALLRKYAGQIAYEITDDGLKQIIAAVVVQNVETLKSQNKEE